MPPLSLDATLYLFHHIILPPELPQESDWKAEYEDALLDTTIEVLRTFAETVRTEQPQVARYVHRRHRLPENSVESTQKDFILLSYPAPIQCKPWEVPSQIVSS
jgi:hypothetical protein